MKHLAFNWDGQYLRREGHPAGPGISTYCGKRMFIAEVVAGIEATDCPTCIEKWETAPQPVTTRDLAEVVQLIEKLAKRHLAPPLTDKEFFKLAGITKEDLAVVDKILQKLKRPRKKP